VHTHSKFVKSDLLFYSYSRRDTPLQGMLITRQDKVLHKWTFVDDWCSCVSFLLPNQQCRSPKGTDLTKPTQKQSKKNNTKGRISRRNKTRKHSRTTDGLDLGWSPNLPDAYNVWTSSQSAWPSFTVACRLILAFCCSHTEAIHCSWHAYKWYKLCHE